MTTIEFHVEGDPVPQGSTRAFQRGGRIVTTNDPSGRLERWRGDIRSAAKLVLPPTWEVLTGPVALGVTFHIRRPKSHYLPVTKSRPVPVLRPDAPMWHDQAPDLDKLYRAVMDALAVVVYGNDSQVSRFINPGKVWAASPGADIRVRELVS